MEVSVASEFSHEDAPNVSLGERPRIRHNKIEPNTIKFMVKTLQTTLSHMTVT